MICEACRDRRHAHCRGGSWCDCQHQPPPADETDGGPPPGDTPEPDVNWLRQG